jgi:hypothetical protein
MISRGGSGENESNLEDEVRRLINRYGAKSTKEALKRLSNRKPRAKLKGDWRLLDGYLKADARRWLEGADPFKERSDYSIAKWFAETHPDKNVEFESTFRRIKRRLSKDRRYYTLVEAFWLSAGGYPYQMQLKVLRELSSGARSKASWQRALRMAEGTLAKYQAIAGPPPATMTMRELETVAVEAMVETNLTHIRRGA